MKTPIRPIAQMLASLLAVFLACVTFSHDTEAFSRNKAVIRAFRAESPCPSTGKASGACPGWQIDHREALVCGGTDTVENLQWLTVEEHRAKTRAEVKLCRGPRKK